MDTHKALAATMVATTVFPLMNLATAMPSAIMWVIAVKTSKTWDASV